MSEKLYGYTAEEWMFVALQMLDGNASPWDIKSQTGLGEVRCEEIAEMYRAATRDGWPVPSAPPPPVKGDST